MKVTDEMVDRFLNWPLPDSVCCDPCACMKNYPNSRIGTNLLTAVEARQMLEHVFDVERALRDEIARLRKVEAEHHNICETLAAKKSGIYIASKTKHAPRWRQLRKEGVPIISTWIDESGVGETSCFTDLWRRCIDEARSASMLIVYREPDEVPNGALIEVGAALANGTPVFAIGFDGPGWSFTHHALVRKVESVDQALAGEGGGEREKCCYCNETATLHCPDPYDSEINHDNTVMWMCAKCYESRQGDI
jgi:hypothetical protein